MSYIYVMLYECINSYSDDRTIKYNLGLEVICQYSCHFGRVLVKAYENIIGICAIWRSKFVHV